jgi:hypothetical protein
MGAFLLLLGGLNSVLAANIDTCTGGSAGSLYGGILTLILYFFGLIAVRVRPPGASIVLLVPACVIAIWHSIFAVRFAIAWWVHNVPACGVMAGHFSRQADQFAVDGGENFLVILWLLLSLVFWVAFALCFFRREEREGSPGFAPTP